MQHEMVAYVFGLLCSFLSSIREGILCFLDDEFDYKTPSLPSDGVFLTLLYALVVLLSRFLRLFILVCKRRYYYFNS